MTERLEDLDFCPACSAKWAYEVEGRRYSRLIGLYNQGLDRTVSWRCPNCLKTWDRPWQ